MTQSAKKAGIAPKAAEAASPAKSASAGKAVPKASPKPAKKADAGPRAASAFAKPMKPSADLAAVIGAEPIARTGVVSKLWEYIKKHDLQDPANKRNIKPDAKLKKVFDGRDVVTMFEMNKFIGGHLS